MATHTIYPSTSQVGGLTSVQISGFTAVQITTALSPADLATINQAMCDDQMIVSQTLGPAASTIQAGIIFTATATANLTSLTSATIVSPSTATLASIQPNMIVNGCGLVPGTRVTSVSGTTVNITPAIMSTPTAGQSTDYVAVQPPVAMGINSYVLSTRRGNTQLLIGDYVFVDLLGNPYVVPNIAVTFNGGGGGSGAPWIYT